jgi:NO-binding membrane sensor protein with MHYT domain
MITYDPSLVILSTTIAILGAFTAAVMASNVNMLPAGEARMRLLMACISLGGSVWAMHFVGLLALEAPINLAYNPGLLALSAAIAFIGTGIALFLSPISGQKRGAREPVAIAVLGLTIAATHYAGVGAIAGPGLHLSWFLAVICLAVSIQAGAFFIRFLFRPRGVIITLIGSAGLGLALSATHYLTISSTEGLDQTLTAIPQAVNPISGHYLAWAATITMYLICSICLCVFVVMQFREDMQ